MYMCNRTDYDCGPVALVNLVNYLCNNKIPKDSQERLYLACLKACKTSVEGTYRYDFDKTLRCIGKELKLKIKRTKNINIEKTKDFLKNKKKVVILSHISRTKDWHLSIFVEYKYSRFYGYNIYYNRERKTTITQETFKKYVTAEEDSNTPTVWFIDGT